MGTAIPLSTRWAWSGLSRDFFTFKIIQLLRLPPNVIYIYMLYRTANLQMLHFKYLFNKRPY
jgi:hypothetical protein